jgi:hypothetical protein
MSFVVVAEPTRSRCHAALLVASTLVLCAAPLLIGQPAKPQVASMALTVADEPITGTVDPALALEFVQWWMTKALDCQGQTKVASHLEATKWMYMRASDYCDAAIWGNNRLDGPVWGSVRFQTQVARVLGIAPGGMVWVDVRGQWVRERGFPTVGRAIAPALCPMEMIILVGRDRSGLRIAKSYLINDAQGCELETFLHGRI